MILKKWYSLPMWADFTSWIFPTLASLISETYLLSTFKEPKEIAGFDSSKGVGSPDRLREFKVKESRASV